MKVFKIKKYHICYLPSVTANVRGSGFHGFYALCGKDRFLKNIRTKDYTEDMDLCKTCRQMNFVRMVNKLKGKYSA